MTKQAHKISKKWIEQNRLLFREFLDETDFPDPERFGERGPKFQYPEWLIMFIAILSVKLKVKSYVQIHRMAMQYVTALGHGFENLTLAVANGPSDVRDTLGQAVIRDGHIRPDRRNQIVARR